MRLVRRVFIAGLLITLVFLMASYESKPIIFSEEPKVSTAWEVVTPTGNTIGSGIVAILRISSPLGVDLDLRTLSDVGAKIGHLEVRERKVRRYREGGSIISEVTYTFQYLEPIDFTKPVTERTGSVGSFIYRYRVWSAEGKPVPQSQSAYTSEFPFSLIKRVKDDLPPGKQIRGLVGPWPEAWRYGLLLEGAGGLIMISPLFVLVWQVFRRRKVVVPPITLPLDPVSEIAKLFDSWRGTGDYLYVKKAARFYRNPFFTAVQADKIAPPPLWSETGEILYSGRALSKEKVEEFFRKLLEVVRDV